MEEFEELYFQKFRDYMKTGNESILLSIYDDIRVILSSADIDTSDVLEVHLEAFREFAKVEHAGSPVPWIYIEQSMQFLAQVLIAMDIYRRKFAEMAFYDPLTSLGNRRLFREISERELLRAKRYNRQFSIALIDLKKFKNINDTYGHEVGDLALQKFAQIMKDSFRRSDSLFRIGGDEFVALFTETNREQTEKALERFLQKLKREKLKLEDGTELTIEANIGLATFPEDGSSLSELLQTADLKMYRAKKSEKNVEW